MRERERERERGCLSLETLIVYVCYSEGERARQKTEVPTTRIVELDSVPGQLSLRGLHINASKRDGRKKKPSRP